jgi:anthranilate synthase component II
MILVLDNFDSFTYNLVQLLGMQTRSLLVKRNNALTLEEIRRLQPAGILISPGPGRPEEAGICLDVIRTFGSTIPLLGVCLGHQAIGLAYGARIVHAPGPMHGKLSAIHHDGTGLFQGMPEPFQATRYHSLIIEPASLPPDLTVTARSADGIIMGIRHRSHPVLGVQFHPESVLTEEGGRMIRNWLGMQK